MASWTPRSNGLWRLLPLKLQSSGWACSRSICGAVSAPLQLHLGPTPTLLEAIPDYPPPPGLKALLPAIWGSNDEFGFRNSAFGFPSHFHVSIFRVQLFVLVKSEVHPIAPANQPIPAPLSRLGLWGRCPFQGNRRKGGQRGRAIDKVGPSGVAQVGKPALRLCPWPLVNVATCQRNELALVPRSPNSRAWARSLAPHKMRGPRLEAQGAN